MTKTKITTGKAVIILRRNGYNITQRTIQNWCRESIEWLHVNPKKAKLKTVKQISITHRYWIDKEEIEKL